MRARHLIAIETAVLVGLVVKIVFFSSPVADANANAVGSPSLDISKMQAKTELAEQNIHDMTFVFPTGIEWAMSP